MLAEERQLVDPSVSAVPSHSFVSIDRPIYAPPCVPVDRPLPRIPYSSSNIFKECKKRINLVVTTFLPREAHMELTLGISTKHVSVILLVYYVLSPYFTYNFGSAFIKKVSGITVDNFGFSSNISFGHLYLTSLLSMFISIVYHHPLTLLPVMVHDSFVLVVTFFTSLRYLIEYIYNTIYRIDINSSYAKSVYFTSYIILFGYVLNLFIQCRIFRYFYHYRTSIVPKQRQSLFSC